MNLYKFPKISLVVLFLILAPVFVKAAELYLYPANGNFSPGETFIEEIKLDTQKESINTIKVNIVYPKELLEIIDFSDAGSIFTLWPERPDIKDSNLQQGIISFTAGTPNGFKGEGGLVGKIIFKVRPIKETEKAEIEFSQETQVLLNDGFGTPAKIVNEGMSFEISVKSSEVLKDNWQEILKKDITPPDSFEILLSRNSSAFGGKYFIIFSTQDKDSGIDYFQVKEGDGDWGKTVSPYVLRDQSLRSIIIVKAVDKAGNERIEVLKPGRRIFLERLLYIGIGLIFGLLLYLLIKNIIRWKR